MKQFDYIIVGQGLAGTVLGYKLRQRGKSVFVVDKSREATSSKVAPGAYNPMVLKRFTPCWKVEEQLQPLYEFIESFEASYKTTIHQPLKLWRKFHSVQEQNLWMEKSEKARLKPFMNPDFKTNPYKQVQADFGFGEVNHAGRVYLPKMIELFRKDLQSNDCLLDADFEHEALKIERDFVTYKSIRASKIVFCEGHRLSANPHFNYLPLMRTKGELITVKLEGLNVSELIKSKVSILPLGDDLYKVGATFNWEQKDELCTEAAKNELLNTLSTLVDVEPKLVKHEAGLRPTVKDRRALMGVHPKHENMYVFNGMGTRGLLISPFLSEHFIAHLENAASLNFEVDIKRYQDLYSC